MCSTVVKMKQTTYQHPLIIIFHWLGLAFRLMLDLYVFVELTAKSRVRDSGSE